MHQVHLSDQVYEAATRQAQESGFPSVEAYVSAWVQHNEDFDAVVDPNAGEYNPDDVDGRFTPKVIEALDRASAGIKAGRFFTPQEVDARHEKRREAWLRTHES